MSKKTYRQWMAGKCKTLPWPKPRRFNPRDPKLDRQVRALCVAMNRLPGIATTGSCCGHNRYPYRIWFGVTDFDERGFVTLARVTCPRYYPEGWKILLDHGDLPDQQVAFLLEGRVGRRAYRDAGRLAGHINEIVDREAGGYNILYDDVDR